MINIGDKAYAFDIEKIYQSVNYSDNTETREKEILDTYEPDANRNPKLVNKTIRELTTPGNAQIDNIKYDLIKTFIIQIITLEDDVIDLEDMPFGTKLAVNTMIKEGFLIEIN